MHTVTQSLKREKIKTVMEKKTEGTDGGCVRMTSVSGDSIIATRPRDSSDTDVSVWRCLGGTGLTVHACVHRTLCVPPGTSSAPAA